MSRIFVPLLAVFLSISNLFAQSKPDGEGSVNAENDPNPDEWVALDKEPIPINMDHIRSRIGYPADAKEAEIEGKVVVRVLIDTTGNYVKHLILKDPHHILTKAVENGITELRCYPAILNGKKTKCWVTIPFDFKLLRNNPIPPPAPEIIAPVPSNPDILVKGIKAGHLKNIPPEKAYVKLRVMVAETGQYVQHVVLESPSTEISKAVSKQAPGLQFSKPLVNGVPKACWTVVSVRLKVD